MAVRTLQHSSIYFGTMPKLAWLRLEVHRGLVAEMSEIAAQQRAIALGIARKMRLASCTGPLGRDGKMRPASYTGPSGRDGREYSAQDRMLRLAWHWGLLAEMAANVLAEMAAKAAQQRAIALGIARKMGLLAETAEGIAREMSMALGIARKMGIALGIAHEMAAKAAQQRDWHTALRLLAETAESTVLKLACCDWRCTGALWR